MGVTVSGALILGRLLLLLVLGCTRGVRDARLGAGDAGHANRPRERGDAIGPRSALDVPVNDEPDLDITMTTTRWRASGLQDRPRGASLRVRYVPLVARQAWPRSQPRWLAGG
jgi:hypothetical protein